MSRRFTSWTVLFLSVYVLSLAQLTACSDLGSTDNLEGTSKTVGTPNAGDRCADGCIWSTYAVTIGAQASSETCSGGMCACVRDGDVGALCDAEGDRPTEPEPSPSLPAESAGSSCADGCIWSVDAVSIGVQSAEARCELGDCACVVSGDLYTHCNPSGVTNPTPTPTPEPEPEPEPTPTPTGPGAPIEGVPYFYQYDNAISPGATCQNTSIAMVLAFYGWQGNPDQITSRYGRRYAQSPAGLAEVFNELASESSLSVRLNPTTSGSLEGLKAGLASGPVIVHGMFTSAGHVLVVIGYDDNGYWVNDPAGAWSETFAGGYSGSWGSRAGEGVYYPRAAFERAVTTLDGYTYAPLWYHTIINR